MSSFLGRRVGELHAAPSRANGKVVDNWTFVSPDPGSKGGCRSVPVDVALMRGADGLYFEARVEGLRERFTSADIEALRQDVESRLAVLDSIRVGVEWEDWLEVTVVANDEEREGVRSMRSGLTIEVQQVKRGVYKPTGEVFGLNRGYAVPFPKAKSASGAVERRHKDEAGLILDTDKEVSYVPDTPANRAALQDIRERLRLLRSRLSEALRHDIIHDTLADVAGKLPLLAAPASDNQDRA